MKNLINENITDKIDSEIVNQDARQFLTFKVGNEEYGVSLMTIREIKGWSNPTVLTNTPAFMKGVINLRGAVIPVFDLRHRLQMGTTDPNEKNVVIIIAINESLVGILVDAVSDILTVSGEQIKPAPKMEANTDENFVEGLIQSGEKMVVILKMENLFDAETIMKAEKLTAQAEFGDVELK